jgi:hypothetical protein
MLICLPFQIYKISLWEIIDDYSWNQIQIVKVNAIIIEIIFFIISYLSSYFYLMKQALWRKTWQNENSHFFFFTKRKPENGKENYRSSHIN